MSERAVDVHQYALMDQKSVKPVNADPRFSIRPLQQMTSACTGAIITACFMTPLDVVKTRMQAQQTAYTAANKCFLYCNGLMDHLCPCRKGRRNKSDAHFKGTVDACLKISRQEGLSALWSGLSPTLISALPSTVIYFFAYEQFKAHLLRLHFNHMVKVQTTTQPSQIPFIVPLMSGVTARLCAVTLVSPIELIRTKMQSEKMTYAQISASVHNVIKTQGLWGLWRGLLPTILRDMPFSGIYWPTYEYLKTRFNVVEPTFGFSFLAGAISGAVAATLTTPFDVVKTYEQIQFGEQVIFANGPPKANNSGSMLTRLTSIYRINGIRGLFAGLGPRLFRVPAACAIMISTFEYSKSFFYSYNLYQHNQSLLMYNKKSEVTKNSTDKK